MQDFRNRVAVITGGASGIGLAVAKALADEGAKLVIADIEQAALDRATNEIHARGAEAVGVLTDVADKAAVERLADRTWEAFGAAHLVMHNAGVVVFGPIHELTHADWVWSINVNLWGPIHGIEAFLPRMVAQGEPGHMVFTASFAGLVPNVELGPYNVSKAAVVALAESVRKDMRAKGISASVLAPMRVVSNIDRSSRNRPADLGGPTANRTYSDGELEGLEGRTLAPDDVARLVLEGVRRDDLVIHTHVEAEGFFRKRAERIAQSFPHAL